MKTVVDVKVKLSEHDPSEERVMLTFADESVKKFVTSAKDSLEELTSDWENPSPPELEELIESFPDYFWSIR